MRASGGLVGVLVRIATESYRLQFHRQHLQLVILIHMISAARFSFRGGLQCASNSSGLTQPITWRECTVLLNDRRDENAPFATQSDPSPSKSDIPNGGGGGGGGGGARNR
jgi:hypothetical protein